MALSTRDTNLLRKYFAGKPVKRAYLFGSHARNTAVKGTSDIDILLELDYSQPIGMKFFSFQRELEDLLRSKVDVVTSDGISKYVLPYIEKDKILIYEAMAGLMSADDGHAVAEAYTAIDQMAKDLGSTLRVPFMTLSFMALLVIPHLKLGDLGLFDGDAFKLL